MKKICFLFLIGLLIFQNSEAQEDNLKTWTSLEISTKLNKRWSIALEENFRTTDNLQSFSSLVSEASIKFKINKRFAIKSAARFYSRDRENANSVRFAGNINYKEKMKRWRFDYRLQTQHELESGTWASPILRNRFRMSYDIKKSKLTPSLGTELFYQFKDRPYALNQFRYFAGIALNTGDNHELSFQYTYQQYRNQEVPERNHIASLNFSIDLKKQKKGNKK